MGVRQLFNHHVVNGISLSKSAWQKEIKLQRRFMWSQIIDFFQFSNMLTNLSMYNFQIKSPSSNMKTSKNELETNFQYTDH